MGQGRWDGAGLGARQLFTKFHKDTEMKYNNFSFLVAVTQAVTDAVIELASEQDALLNTIKEENDDSSEENSIIDFSEIERKNGEESSQRVYHYDKVETQINIEKLYLTLPHESDLDNKIKSSEADSFFLVNPKYNNINKIIKSYFTSNNTQYNSPMILKMKTDL